VYGPVRTVVWQGSAGDHTAPTSRRERACTAADLSLPIPVKDDLEWKLFYTGHCRVRGESSQPGLPCSIMRLGQQDPSKKPSIIYVCGTGNGSRFQTMWRVSAVTLPEDAAKKPPNEATRYPPEDAASHTIASDRLKVTKKARNAIQHRPEP
jgi:hypothetical protein